MSEVDLAKKVIDWLIEQHWDVYQEVSFTSIGGIADIVAVRAGKLWIIECKTALTFSVLEQASHWRSHYRSIAVPESDSKGRYSAYDIARNYLNIGVITVRNLNVYERKTPPLMREYHRYAKRMINDLCDEQKTYCPAGSISGGRFTPYRRTMDEVKHFISTHPGCNLQEIINGIDQHHYANDKSAMGSIRVALEKWETSWCDARIVNGKITYFLNR